MSELKALTEPIDPYDSFLKSSNKVQLRNQALPYPVRQLKDYVTVQHIPANPTVVDAYKLLNEIVVEADEYAPVIFKSEKHLENSFHDQKVAYHFFKEMQLTLPVNLLRYDLLFIGSFFAPAKIVMGERESIIFKTRTSSNIEFSGKKTYYNTFI